MPPRSPSRRDFVRLLGRAAVAGSLPGWLQAEPIRADDLVTISILHTTDLHGHILPTTDYHGLPDLGGFARCVTQINRWRAENPNSLLLDIGDVYQGTQFALARSGTHHDRSFQLCRYDAWLVGNHEFDWGLDPFLGALDRSAMPVLAANLRCEDQLAGAFPDARHPFAKVQPFLLKEIAGIRIAVIGLTTPGMPFWFLPDFLRGMEFENPIEPTRRAIAEAKSLGAHAIVLAGHMGLKERTGGDDFANRVMALTAEFPEVAVYIAGHTHQDLPSRFTHGVLFTQADHFGIHVGRVDLVFDRTSRKLLSQSALTTLMDDSVPLDPVILSRTRPQLDRAADVLAERVGELSETLGIHAVPGAPSEVELLIAAATTEALGRRGVKLDGVFHGLFDDRHVLKKGPKTIGDIWGILPYENYLVTADLTSAELEIILNEVFESREARSLAGFQVASAGQGSARRLTSLRLASGQPLEPMRRYRTAFNTFDARSAGHRFMKLRAILESPPVNCTAHPVQTREALIDYFRHHRTVRRADLGRTAA